MSWGSLWYRCDGSTGGARPVGLLGCGFAWRWDAAGPHEGGFARPAVGTALRWLCTAGSDGFPLALVAQTIVKKNARFLLLFLYHV